MELDLECCRVLGERSLSEPLQRQFSPLNSSKRAFLPQKGGTQESALLREVAGERKESEGPGWPSWMGGRHKTGPFLSIAVSENQQALVTAWMVITARIRSLKGVVLKALWACTFHMLNETALTSRSARPGAGGDTGVGKGSLTRRGTRPLVLQQGHGCRNAFCIAAPMTDAVPRSYVAPSSPGPCSRRPCPLAARGTGDLCESLQAAAPLELNAWDLWISPLSCPLRLQGFISR